MADRGYPGNNFNQWLDDAQIAGDLHVGGDLTVDGSSPGGGSQSLSAFTITAADVLAAPGTHAAIGTLAVGGNNIAFHSAPGIAGNAIYVSSPTSPPDTAATTAALDGTGIVLTLASDSEGLSVAIFQHVKEAIEANPETAALVTVVRDGNDTYPFEAVVELIGGESVVACADLASGSVIEDATVYFPLAFDSGLLMRPTLGPDYDIALFDDGDPDPSSGDSDGGGPGVWYITGQPSYNPTHRFRLSESVPLSVLVQGVSPSEGEMLLVVDVRMPA